MWRLILVAGMALAGGCNNGSQTVMDPGGTPREVAATRALVARAIPPIPDLPVPVGFKLDEGRSRNFRGGSARYVDHVYKGGADKFAVARFYMRQMPIQRWALVTDMFVQGDVMMDFRKESESCRVIVSGGGTLSSTKIRVTLWTSGRIQDPGKGKK
jgi:hypothetical protein